MDHPVEIEYRGVVYKRNPESPEWPKRVYYQAPRKSGRSYLHRDIYADTTGVLPAGMHVHHRDHDPFNNDPLNLVVLTPSDHQKLHREHNGKFDEARMEIHRATTLKEAAKWHGSEEGLAWHRENGKKVWESREPDGVFTCPECGTEHQGYFANRGDSGESRYCSGACRQRGDKRLGKYEAYKEDAVCPMCGVSFKRWRGRSKTCSRSCGAKLRWRGEP
jgi:rubredoxin